LYALEDDQIECLRRYDENSPTASDFMRRFYSGLWMKSNIPEDERVEMIKMIAEERHEAFPLGVVTKGLMSVTKAASLLARKTKYESAKKLDVPNGLYNRLLELIEEKELKIDEDIDELLDFISYNEAILLRSALENYFYNSPNETPDELANAMENEISEGLTDYDMLKLLVKYYVEQELS
jgi:hypothetical protein